MDGCCTARGRLPIQLDDGLVFWQLCYYSKNMIETIISPQLIVNSSDVFCSWQQTGYRDGDGTPGSIRFDSHDGCVSMQMTLWMKDGLYYCPTDIYTVHDAPAIWCSPAAHQLTMPLDNVVSPVAPPHQRRSRFVPITKAKQMESEVWLLQLGSPGVCQLDLLPGCVTGIPSEFWYHPFHFINHKENASVKKRSVQHLAVCTNECKCRYYMDFGFMRSSTSN
jgi:hypothetical protein